MNELDIWAAERTGLFDSLTASNFEAWQFARIREAITRARVKGAFYQQLFCLVDVERLRGRDDMSMLPFTTSADLMMNNLEMVCAPMREISRITTVNTSGSTGIPKRIYFTEGDIERTVDFFEHGMSGIARQGRKAFIMMSDTTRDSLADLLKRALERIGVIPVIYGPITDEQDAADAIRDAVGCCVIGTPREITRLCGAFPAMHPGSVLLSSDYVPESSIRSIAGLWGCPVYTHYGMTETGFGLAVQCSAHTEYHPRYDVFVEVIDPLTRKNASVGEVVVTTFANEAMPLFRYRTGDIAGITFEPCKCGSVLPRLTKVQRRIDDVILLDNRSFTIQQLDEIVFAMPGIHDYRAKLVDNEKLELTVDTAEQLNEARMDKIRSLVGDKFTIQYQELEHDKKKRRIT